MEKWRSVLRRGFLPGISTQALTELLGMVRADDSRIVQEMTTNPPAWPLTEDRPVEQACIIGCAGMLEGCNTVGRVSDYFGRKCAEADLRIGEAAGCRWFLNWFDETPRVDVMVALAEEIERELANRQEGSHERE